MNDNEEVLIHSTSYAEQMKQYGKSVSDWANDEDNAFKTITNNSKIAHDCLEENAGWIVHLSLSYIKQFPCKLVGLNDVNAFLSKLQIDQLVSRSPGQSSMALFGAIEGNTKDGGMLLKRLLILIILNNNYLILKQK